MIVFLYLPYDLIDICSSTDNVKQIMCSMLIPRSEWGVKIMIYEESTEHRCIRINSWVMLNRTWQGWFDPATPFFNRSKKEFIHKGLYMYKCIYACHFEIYSHYLKWIITPILQTDYYYCAILCVNFVKDCF